jgi:hypothetical protein
MGGSVNNQKLAIGGRTIKKVTSTAYEFVATDKSEYLVIDEVGDDVVLSLDDSLFDNGDTIIGVGGVESFSLTIDNPIGDINPIATASFTINYLDEFTITKIGASTWILTITNYASNQSGGEVQRSTATSGTQSAPDTNKEVIFIHEAGATASLTYQFPPSPVDKQKVTIMSVGGITALTLSAAIGTIVNTITTLALGGSATYMYLSSQTKWYKIG